MADRTLVQELAAKVTAIANDCFDRPAAERLRQFGEGVAPDGLPMPENGLLELSDSAL